MKDDHVTLYCTVNYHFKGNFWIEPLKKLALKYFMPIREKWVDIVNPEIPAANKLFEELHPNLANTKLEGAYLEIYDRWMSKELDRRVLLRKGKHPGNFLFYGKCNPEYPDFRLCCRFSKHMFVDYDLNILKD